MDQFYPSDFSDIINKIRPSFVHYFSLTVNKMGCNNSKNLGEVDEPQALSKEQVAKKALTEAEAAAKVC